MPFISFISSWISLRHKQCRFSDGKHGANQGNYLRGIDIFALDELFLVPGTFFSNC